MVLRVVELPLAGDGKYGWPLEEMFRYRNMVRARFFAELGGENLWATCLFRSPEEFAGSGLPDGCGGAGRLKTDNGTS